MTDLFSMTMFWSILAYALALALGLIGYYYSNKKLLFAIYFLAVATYTIFVYQQKNQEPPSRVEFRTELTKHKKEIAEQVVADIKQELSDTNNSPKFMKIKKIAQYEGRQYEGRTSKYQFTFLKQSVKRNSCLENHV